MPSSVLEIMLAERWSEDVFQVIQMLLVLRNIVILEDLAVLGRPIVMIIRCISTAREAQRRLV